MIQALLAALAAAVGFLFFSNSKKNSAEALLENVATKTKLNELDVTISKNTGLLESEEAKRTQIKEEADAKANSPVTDSNILDFLNKK